MSLESIVPLSGLAQAERFQVLINAVKDYAIYLLDADGRVVTWNPGAERIKGYRADEIIGQHFSAFYSEEDREAGLPARALQTATEEGRFEAEGWRVRKDGTRFWSHVVMDPVLGADGQVIGYAKIARDISNKREIDEALRASEQRFRLLVQGVRDYAIYMLDPDGKVSNWNVGAEAINGYSEREIVGQHFSIFYTEDDRQAGAPERALETARRHGKFEGEAIRVRKGGERFWANVLIDAIHDDNGDLVGFAKITRDITERQNVLESLQRSEENFRSLADTMPQIVWAAKPDGSLDYYNRRWFEYIHLSPDAMEEARWDQYIHPEDLPRAFAAWTACLSTGEPYEIEFRVRRADGDYRWFLVRALPVRDARGVISRWFGTCTDIHDQKRLIQERDDLLASERAARSTAEHASRMKDEFLATLSHELRSPLNAIFGWSQILRESSDDPATITEGLDVVDRNVRSLTQLIEDLLDMSRIISGKLRMDIQHVDPGRCVEAAIETVVPAAEAKGIRIQRKFDPQAGPISGDPGRIQQIVWNLLSNAVKFTHGGGRVEVSLAWAPDHLEISVADTGQGIHPDFLPYVFDRFRQEDAAMNRKHGGLGLGLAIVKQLVELHGGTIRALSAGLDQGTTFVVRLPLRMTHPHLDDGSEPQTRANAPAAFRKNASLQGLKVLVLDDEPDGRDLLKRILGDCGAQVITAASALEALSLISVHLPDVLVSDIGMPEVDGYEFMRRVRALPADHGGRVPSVALTAFARSEDRARALMAGFLAHVSKPLDPSELVATIAAVAGRNGAGGVM